MMAKSKSVAGFDTFTPYEREVMAIAIMEEADNLWLEVKAADSALADSRAKLDAAEAEPTTFATKSTLDYEHLNNKNALDESLANSTLHLDQYQDIYVQRAARLALEDGVVIIL